MAVNSFTVKVSNFRAESAKLARQYSRDQLRAAAIATDQVAREYQRLTKEAIASAGLGRLGGAVKERAIPASGQYGPSAAVFAAGGDDSLAGGALEAYTQGVTIKAANRTWLAFATSVIPRRVGRYRMTPERYVAAGYNQTLGKLVFRPVNSRIAFLIVRRTNQHVRTGRIKLPGKRASKVFAPARDVVVFVLIRSTYRAKRIDKDGLAQVALLKMPGYIDEAFARLAPA